MVRHHGLICNAGLTTPGPRDQEVGHQDTSPVGPAVAWGEQCQKACSVPAETISNSSFCGHPCALIHILLECPELAKESAHHHLDTGPYGRDGADATRTVSDPRTGLSTFLFHHPNIQNRGQLWRGLWICKYQALSLDRLSVCALFGKVNKGSQRSTYGRLLGTKSPSRRQHYPSHQEPTAAPSTASLPPPS